jgi:hypothetical protein
VRDALILLAIIGVVYGAYALYSIGNFTDQHRDEVNRKSAELKEQAFDGSASGLLFGIFRPVYWLVALPVVSVPAALGVAFLMVLPALLFV